ncbi:AzlC family ABC transporter permease [Zavarzinia compransoris]|uniref:Branched-chain amino acid ABC transporter permease n=1 Tax=Zavarzinia compransoris TaxID=1264899 RepID=A0A317DTI6_9PROT|nr:AzlC family ABC transporter permease [Zavarzinia compransoris]PWR18007.1 branched-chain amino acid ABC transporter permease [Zavarzinia compransoris]TDP43528.1 4-azaleucine resistance transporter AzlC [Zavarzinia compransoris]
MTTGPDTPTPWTEFRDGLTTVFPAIAAAVPFALLIGALAVDKGLSALESGLMSALVFAGASQFVALDSWSAPAPWLALGLTALVVNLRHGLMSLSLVRHLGLFPRWLRPLALLLMVDESWAFAEARAARHPLTPAFYAGLTVVFYLSWVAATLAGAALGSLLRDPKALGLDFTFIAIFIVLILGFRARPGFAAIVPASAGTAALVDALYPGPWSIMAGALAGVLLAMLRPVPGAREAS